MDTLFGEIEIIPPHLIILDRTKCNHRNFTPQMPPVSTPPTPDPRQTSSKTCSAFYDHLVSTYYTGHFICNALSCCNDGVQCFLNILDVSYEVMITVGYMQTGLVLQVRDLEESGTLLGKGSSNFVSISLPKPVNSNLTMMQMYNSTTKVIGFSVSSCIYI